MGNEIERKFLVTDGWRQQVHHSVVCRQGYLSTAPERTVRVRIMGDNAFLTIKGQTRGYSRHEFEYPIPVADAQELLQMAVHPLVEKIRHYVQYAGMLWEIDEFSGDNAGLVVAEIELEEEAQSFHSPPWLGQEVTEDKRYYNASLSRSPYSLWEESNTHGIQEPS